MAWWDELTCERCGESIEPDEIEWGESVPTVCGMCRVEQYRAVLSLSHEGGRHDDANGSDN
jgi:hypothetical protein